MMRRYVTEIAATDHNTFFAREARFSPDALNAREEAALESTLQQAAPAGVEPSADMAAAPVIESVQSQLEAAGVEPSTARSYASLHGAAFGTLGTRFGVDPVALFQRYGLEISREGLAPLVAERSARAEQEAEAGVVSPLMRELAERTAADNAKRRGTPADVGHSTAAQQLEVARQEALREYLAVGDVRASVPASYPTAGESVTQRTTRRQSQRAEVLAAVLRDAQRVDPNVDVDLVRTEFQRRHDLHDEQRELLREAGRDPVDLLRAVAGAGGLGPESAGGLTGELRHLKEGTRFGTVHGVARVFRAARELDDRGQPVSGLAFDEMLDRLHQDARFQWIESVDQLLEALDAAMRATPEGDVFPGTADLKPLGIRFGSAWWQSTSYQQDERGAIRFGPDRQFRIELLKHANLTTFIHESGHFWLEVLGDVVDELGARDLETLTAPQRQMLADYGTVLQWLGVENRREVQASQHEQFARGVEAYLLEGHAPSDALRAVFARVRAWLVSVYRTVRRLQVELTPEVRAVLDRLLATDDAITAAQQDAAATPLFTDAIAQAAGLSPREFEDYQATVQVAGDAARDQVQAKLLRELKREREAWWRRERAHVRAEVAADVAEQPVYRALAHLQRGTQPDGSPLPDGVEPFKLSKAGIVDEFGEAFLAKLPRPLVYSNTSGVPPSVAAELLGFQSSRGLMNALVTAPPMADAIDALADARMRERHGDLLLDGRLADVAQHAVADAGAEVFAAEAAMLNRLATRAGGRPGVPPVPVRALRDIAERRIAGLAVGQIRPGVFAAAARRAGQQALEAAARRDFATASQAKQQQILNAELHRAAVAATETIGHALDAFRAVFARDTAMAKTHNMDLVAAARALLGGAGLAPRPQEQSALAYLRQVEQYDPETYADLQAAIDAASQPAESYRAMSLDDFVAFRDAVLSWVHVARRSRQIVIDGKTRDLEEVREELELQLAATAAPAKRPPYQRKLSRWQETRLYLLGWRAALRRVESWVDAVDDGDPRGAFRRLLFAPVSDAASRYRDQKGGLLERYRALAQAIAPGLSPHDIEATELSYTFSGKAELLHAVLHTGNESNLRKLLLGNHETRPAWGELRENGTLDASRWDRFLRRMWAEGVLTKADYDFVQAVWDLNEELKPQAQAVHHALYGYYFAEITAQPLTTPFGSYRGGYVPAIYDALIDDDAARRSDREAVEQTPNSFMFPTTGRGFTIARVEAYVRPLALDLRLVPLHLDKVLRFIHLQPVVKDAGRLVIHKGFRAKLAALDRTVAGELLLPWLQRAARQSVDTPAQGWGGRGADRFFRALRRRTGLQIMTANVLNALQQVTGLSVSALKVPIPALTRALWQYARQPNVTADAVAEKSVFMRTRTTTQVMEVQSRIDDLLLNPSAYERGQAFAQRHGYILQQGFQNVVDVVTWSGAYDHAIAEGASEPDAVSQADRAVRLTQGSFNPEDLSAFETGTPFARAFTMFYSYWNNMANTLGTEYVLAMRAGGLRASAGRLLYVYSLGFMIPALVGDAIVRAGGGEWDEDEDGLELLELVTWFFGAQRRAATAMVPGAGTAINAALNVWNDRPYDDRISVSPAITTLESAVRAPYAAYRAMAEGEVRKRDVRDVLTAVGMATGLPAGAVARPLGYLADVATGEEEPSGPVDAGRGVIVGR